VKHLLAAAYDATAAAYAGHTDRLVYRYLAQPLVRALRGVPGPVLDVASGAGALGRSLPAAVALDLSMGQLAHNPLPARVCADAERLPFRDGAFAAACCAFGVNHFPDPLAAVTEMARVAPLVGLLTWERPEAPYAPKQAVQDAIARHAPASRSPAGRLIDALGERVGSAGALRSLLAGAGLRAAAEVVTAVVPWPGAAAFTEYRLANAGAAGLLDGVALERARRDAAAAIARLPPASLEWRPRLVVAIGRRGPGTVRC
jgi:SAM-dependent methyltransferase